MTTFVHITADRDFWTGASTTALLAAQSEVDSLVVSALPDAMLERFRACGVKTVRCKVDGMFGALNLSRVLRNVEGTNVKVILHSPSAQPIVEKSLQLVGQSQRFELVVGCDVQFPKVEVEPPAVDAEPLLMWLGNITASCGLLDLIEYLGTRTERNWRLRVVGQGKAKDVVPILNRCKALGINDRIEWSGYSDCPYKQMNGVSIGIARAGSVAAREFAAASISVVNNVNELDEKI